MEDPRAGNEQTVIHARIASLSLDATTEQPVLVLAAVNDEARAEKLLPIWIGPPEATAILLELQGVIPPRPLTHDLFKSVLEAFDALLMRVEITRLEEGTFFAALVLRAEERVVVVDARPSDSVALAIRFGAPIYVAEEVFDEAAIEMTVVTGTDEEDEIARFRDFLDHVDPADFQH